MLKSPTRPNLTSAPTLVRHWEVAGASLADAVANYLELSTSLASSSRDPSGNTDDLVLRIDTSLQTLHKTLDQQLHQSRVALAKARNKWASPVCRLPQEILSEIFLTYVYGPSKYTFRFPPHAGRRVHSMYEHLYDLSGVCNAWRQIALGHSKLWSIVPMTDITNACWHPLSVELSAQRSNPQNLHVVVDATHRPAAFRKEDFYPLIQSLSRIQSLNIRSRHVQDVPCVLPFLFAQGIPQHLSDLSLTFTEEEDQIHRISSENDFFVRKLAPLLPWFPTMMGSLRVFRINNVPFQWKHVTFSARLVELRIEKIVLTGDLEIAAFMIALSSACKLRDLKLIQVEAFADSGSTLSESQLSLPRLQTVYLQEIYFNFLHLVLRSIAPRSYCLTLNLTKRVKQNMFANSRLEYVSADTILQLLAQHTVNKLIVADDLEDWATGKRFNKLLRSLPALKSLEIYFYGLDKQLFTALAPPSNSPDTLFPKLEALEFRACTSLESITSLPHLVTQHSIRSLVLGQSKTLFRPNEQVAHIDETHKTVRWLKDNVPGFRFIPNDDAATGFSDIAYSWQL